MDVSKLQVGQVYSYKQLCELTGAEYKRGAGKTYQLEKFCETGFQRFFNFEKVARGKYEILEIYDEPLPIEDKRREGNASGTQKISIKDNQFKIFDAQIAHSSGVYKIENNECIYIGSTTSQFTNRFSQHLHNWNGNHEKTQDILLNGGEFTCLQAFENSTDEKIIREAEAEYIRKYQDTEKILLNDKLPEIITSKEKVEYEFIRIPIEYSDDIKTILKDNGYLIINHTVFNKKFDT